MFGITSPMKKITQTTNRHSHDNIGKNLKSLKAFTLR